MIADILKQPLQTSITIENLDFDEFHVEENLHIGISVKDFRAIVNHAETLKTTIKALYSFATRPLLLSYEEHGMHCEFTLMTIGDYRGESTTPTPTASRQLSAAPSASTTEPDLARQSSNRYSRPQPPKEPDHARQPSNQKLRPQPSMPMPPPSQPASRSFGKEPGSQRAQRPSPPPPKASLDPDSLFLPDEDEDRQWGERNYDDEEDTLGWNPTASNVSFRLWCSGSRPDNVLQARNTSRPGEERQDGSSLEPYPTWSGDAQDRLPPTQRLSEVCTHLYVP